MKRFVNGKWYRYEARYITVYLHKDTQVFYDALKENGANMSGSINAFIQNKALKELPHLIEEVKSAPEKIEEDE